MSGGKIFSGVLTLVVSLTILGACEESREEAPPASSSADPNVAATVEPPPRPTDEQNALDAVAGSCTETPDKLDAEAANAVTVLANAGVDDETTTTMLQHLRDSIPSGMAPMSCADILALYVVQRKPH